MNIKRLKKATKEINPISLGYFFTAIGGLLDGVVHRDKEGILRLGYPD